MTTDLTDRYVGATLRSIPEKQKRDIEAELRASIEDAIEVRMAAGEDTRTAERTVLQTLGDPDRLAAGYTEHPGHLIGPEHFFVYKRLLAVLMITVVPIVTAIVAILQVLAGADIGSVFAQAVRIAISLVLHIAFWTTLAFAVIERSGGKDRTAEWSVDGLPALPGVGSVKPGETIASIAFLVFVIAAIIFSRNVSPVAADDGTAITVFDPEMWSFWFPYFVAVLTFEIIFEAVKYRVGRWTWPLASANLALNALFAVPAIYLLKTEQLFNPEFFVNVGWRGEPAGDGIAVLLASVTIGAIAAWEIFDGFRKASR